MRQPGEGEVEVADLADRVDEEVEAGGPLTGFLTWLITDGPGRPPPRAISGI
jgi:hypothetical protein